MSYVCEPRAANGLVLKLAHLLCGSGPRYRGCGWRSDTTQVFVSPYCGCWLFRTSTVKLLYFPISTPCLTSRRGQPAVPVTLLLSGCSSEHHLTCALIRQVTALLSCDENGTAFPHIHKQLIRDDSTPAEKHQIFCKCWDVLCSSRGGKNTWCQKEKSYFLFYRGWIHPQWGGNCSAMGPLVVCWTTIKINTYCTGIIMSNPISLSCQGFPAWRSSWSLPKTISFPLNGKWPAPKFSLISEEWECDNNSLAHDC